MAKLPLALGTDRSGEEENAWLAARPVELAYDCRRFLLLHFEYRYRLNSLQQSSIAVCIGMCEVGKRQNGHKGRVER